MNKIVYLTLVLSLSFLNFADARSRKKKEHNPVYIEPYTGYFIGKLEGDDLPDGDLKSFAVGARVGVALPNKMVLGIDYALSDGNFTRDADGERLDLEQRDFGAFVGYNFHPKFFAYGSYIFLSETEVENSSDTKGDGYNAGISFKVFPQLKVGLEYQIRNYKELDDGTDLTGDNSSTTYLLNLRLPIPFPFKIR